MSFPKMTEPVNNISQLDTRPNAVNGLTADQLKAEFDKGPQAIKKFLNEVLIPALDGAVTLEALGAVPNTRTVARKALSADILLDESDIDYDGTIDGTRVQGDLGDAIDTIGQKLGNAVPNTRTVNGKTLAQDIRLGASDIDYSGKIGEYEASDVGAAIEALVTTIDGYPSNGNPLDMTDDYTASGAASVEQWATMAAAQTATEGATRPAPKYRVSAGRYRIAENDNLEAYDVSILDVPSDTGRVVLIKQINSDPFLYCSVYTATAPGATANNIFFLSTEEHLLEFGAGKNMLLPQYSDKVAGGDYDKFLQLALVGQKVIPKWKNYEAKDISFQNSMTEMGRASNVEEALDELYAAGTLDATEIYETSGANSVVAWAGMADVQDATKYRVPSGTYRVRDSDSDGNYVEHIVTIVDTTYEWDNGQVFRYRQVEDKYCGNEPCIIVEWNQFNAPGEKATSLRYYGDDEEFIVNGVNKHWLPEVTAADNGKFLQVVNGNWEAAKPPTYDGGVS